MSKIIVCDTGPILHLGEANCLYLLNLAGEVNITPVVAREYEQNAPNMPLPSWVHIVDLDKAGQKRMFALSKQIDQGESSVIALTLQLKADWLLCDDANARLLGESLGLEIHGSIGILIWAVANGYIKTQLEALKMLDGLNNTSLWISSRVLRHARKAILELFEN